MSPKVKRALVVALVTLIPGGAIVAALWWWMGRKAASSGRVSRWATQARRDKCDPLLVAKIDAVTARLDAAGRPVVVTDGYRSSAEQDALASKGGLASGGVTNARGGQSPHNYGCAVDMAPMDAQGRPTWPNDPAAWGPIGEAVEGIGGLVWGGRWSTPDRPHAELADWRTRRAAGVA